VVAGFRIGKSWSVSPAIEQTIEDYRHPSRGFMP